MNGKIETIVSLSSYLSLSLSFYFFLFGPLLWLVHLGKLQGVDLQMEKPVHIMARNQQKVCQQDQKHRLKILAILACVTGDGRTRANTSNFVNKKKNTAYFIRNARAELCGYHARM
jgi:hypothetical protein